MADDDDDEVVACSAAMLFWASAYMFKFMMLRQCALILPELNPNKSDILLQVNSLSSSEELIVTSHKHVSLCTQFITFSLVKDNVVAIFVMNH